MKSILCKKEMLVGSKAANVVGLLKRNRPSDLDIWLSANEKVPNIKAEISIMPDDIMEAFSEKSKKQKYATLDDLMTIKLSHLQYDIKWLKHLNDYLVLKHSDCCLNEELYYLLVLHWKKVFQNKRFLSLYKTKDAFFDDFVPKKYDHDWLHSLVAYPNQPIYISCLQDGQEVAIDPVKFDKLGFDDKVKMFREEINVIAMERWVIPSKGKISYHQAYHRSLHKTVTALTKGWACEFILKNIEDFLYPNKNEIKYVLSQIKEFK